MSRDTFQISRDYMVEHKPARRNGACFGFLPRFILIFALVSAVSAINLEQESKVEGLQVILGTLEPPRPSTSTAAPNPSLSLNYRLPKSLIPIHYDLRLQVFLPFEDEETSQPDAFTTKGTIDIHFLCAAATDLIVLHAWNLTFHSYALSGDGLAIATRPPVHDDVRHLLVFKVNKSLQSGKTYVLHLQYQGLIVDENQGFCRSSYVVGGSWFISEKTLLLETTLLADIELRWLAATHFPTRRVFPCFDEPEYRATFDIALTHDTRHSGTFSVRDPAKSKSDGTTNGISWTTTTFERTQRMPPYTTALLVSDFRRSVTTLSCNPPREFGVIYRAGVLADTDFANDVGYRMANHIGTMFNMSYFASNNKLDMAALPDFEPGAMENWGLIFYREGYMLYRPGVSTASDKRGVAGIVAHELAHQWFGNAVTCSWWSQVFLNEAFATFLEYPLTEHEKPEWRMAELFTSRETRAAYDIDSYESSIPLYREVDTQDEVSQMFGAVAYQKGAAVLRMIEGVMGTSTLFAALTKYLAEMSVTGITTYQHLLNAFSAEMPAENMTERFEKWITQSGFPLVTVSLAGPNITLRQERFLLGNSSSAFAEQIWPIPFSFHTNADGDAMSATRPRLWLTNRQEVFPESVSTNRKWLLADVEHYGYYRVNYDLANWNALVEQLKENHEVVRLNNRVQLLDDAFNLARKGLLPYVLPFDLVSYLGKETEYPPWLAAFDNFAYMDAMLGEEPVWQSYMTDLVTGQYSDGLWNTQEVWIDDSIENYHELEACFPRVVSGVHCAQPGLEVCTNSRYNSEIVIQERGLGCSLRLFAHGCDFQSHRSLMIERACYYGIPQCTERAKAELDAYYSSTATKPAINPHLREIILCYGIRQGGEAELDFMLARYDASDVHAVKLAHLQGVACSSSCAVIDRLLTMTINSTLVRSQDMGHIFGYISKFPVGVQLAWKFIKNNWTHLRRRSNIIAHICTNLKTAEELEEVSTFFVSLGQNIPEKLAFKEAIAKIQANIEWVREHKSAVVAALQSPRRNPSSR